MEAVAGRPCESWDSGEMMGCELIKRCDQFET